MVYLERKCVFVALLPSPAFAAASHETPAGDRHAAQRAGAARLEADARAGQYVNGDSKRVEEVAEGPAGGIRDTDAHGAEPPPEQRHGHVRARYHPCQLQLHVYLTHR